MKKEDLKIGDLVVITRNQCGASTGEIVIINTLRESSISYEYHKNILGANFNCIRKATLEEIFNYYHKKLNTINDFPVFN